MTRLALCVGLVAGFSAAQANGSAGVINVAGNFSVPEGSDYEWELGADAWDLVIVTGTVDFEGEWYLRVGDIGGNPQPSMLYDIIRCGTLTDNWGNYTITTAPSTDWDVSNAYLVAGQYDDDWEALYLTGLAVPEPGTLALALLGLLAADGGWLARQRYRRKQEGV